MPRATRLTVTASPGRVRSPESRIAVIAMRVLAFAALALALSVLLAGCAGGMLVPATPDSAMPNPATTSPHAPVPLVTPAADFSCGIGVSSLSPFVGEDLHIARTPAGPCMGIVPGSTQNFHLRVRNDIVILGEVVVADDGSFALTARIPGNTALGTAWLVPDPTPEFPCDDVGLGSAVTADCVVPNVELTLAVAPQYLAPLAGVLDSEQGTFGPGHDPNVYAYATPGPADNQLTVTLFGSSCVVAPVSYVTSAPTTRLELVSETQVPPGMGCDGAFTIWTTIVSVPDRFIGYTSVRVDNIDAVLLPAVRPADGE